jgi:hypothetical protein
MSKRSLFASLLAVLFASSCATLFQGNSEEIMVESDPPGAQVSVNDGRQGITPYSLKTNRNDDLEIHVSKPGYSPEDIADTTHVEWGYLVSDIFFTGLIGLAVDGIDGAMFYHNQTMVSAHLEPAAMAAAPLAPSTAAAVASDQPRTYSAAVPVINRVPTAEGTSPVSPGTNSSSVNPNAPTNQPPPFE